MQRLLQVSIALLLTEQLVDWKSNQTVVSVLFLGTCRANPYRAERKDCSVLS
jgi:hypothetical protein